MASSLYDLQYHVLLDVLGVLSDVIFFYSVFVVIRWIVGLWYEYTWEVIEYFMSFIMHDCYRFVHLSDLSIQFGQLDWFIFSGRGALWWVESCGLYIQVPEGDKTHICIVAIKGKTMWFIHVDWVYFVCIMSSCLRRYSIIYELNTLDSCRIAVDV